MTRHPSAAALAAALQYAKEISATVIYRQVRTAHRNELWIRTPPGGRWNPHFPALYVSLEQDVALAERIKRTGALPTSLVVGIGSLHLPRALDIRLAKVQALLRITRASITRDNYGTSHILAALLFDAGVTGLIVPAALLSTARMYPHFWFDRDDARELRRTPSGGANVVVFGRNVDLDETDRFECTIRGVPR